MYGGSERTIGQRIRQSRDERGLTQQKLAALVGLSERAINKIEKGILAVSMYRDYLSMIANELGVTEYFIEHGDLHSERETSREVQRMREEGILDSDEEMRNLEELASQAIKKRSNVLIPLNRLELLALLEVMRP